MTHDSQPHAIVAAHYGETERRLQADPIVIAMAIGLERVPRDQLQHDGGTPRHEFMMAAMREYASRGGKDGGHIGAVSAALLALLDACRQTDGCCCVLCMTPRG